MVYHVITTDGRVRLCAADLRATAAHVMRLRGQGQGTTVTRVGASEAASLMIGARLASATDPLTTRTAVHF